MSMKPSTFFKNTEFDVPRGKIARTPDEAAAIALEFGKPVFLKAQITVSGRGKAGGILPASYP